MNVPAVTDQERDDILRHLPIINEIKDITLRENVIGVWAKFRRDSPYASIGDAPGFRTEMAENETIVRHTLAATRMAIAAAGQFQRVYRVKLNFDRLLAAGALHDVDKIVLYGKKGDVVDWNDLGRKEKHGDYGARIAEKLGIPGDVVNIVASHSPRRTVMPETIEGALFAYCDLGCMQGYRMMTGKGFEA